MFAVGGERFRDSRDLVRAFRSDDLPSGVQVKYACTTPQAQRGRRTDERREKIGPKARCAVRLARLSASVRFDASCPVHPAMQRDLPIHR